MVLACLCLRHLARDKFETLDGLCMVIYKLEVVFILNGRAQQLLRGRCALLVTKLILCSSMLKEVVKFGLVATQVHRQSTWWSWCLRK